MLGTSGIILTLVLSCVGGANASDQNKKAKIDRYLHDESSRILVVLENAKGFKKDQISKTCAGYPKGGLLDCMRQKFLAPTLKSATGASEIGLAGTATIQHLVVEKEKQVLELRGAPISAVELNFKLEALDVILDLIEAYLRVRTSVLPVPSDAGDALLRDMTLYSVEENLLAAIKATDGTLTKVGSFPQIISAKPSDELDRFRSIEERFFALKKRAPTTRSQLFSKDEDLKPFFEGLGKNGSAR
jgi:hypothetical protein